MSGSIIWMICVCGVGLIFFGISNYAEKKTTPMWFITGGLVSPNIISDVKEYNRENATMWRNYSVTYFAAGIVHFFDQTLAIVVLALTCTVGIGWLFWTYKKILAKYKCDPPKKVAKKKKK
ncbi:MAG: hypothetical protein Q4B18_04685 [Bacillota bacterium]|nr:hypothetical protein [Bacillota bacterium]